jgi:hypothetical protein
MKTELLLDVKPTSKSARVKLTEFKRLHGIGTYCSPGLRREDHPWIAIVPFDEDKGKSIGEIMAHSCRLYEESGYCATGAGELSAIRTLCKQLNIVCTL